MSATRLAVMGAGSVRCSPPVIGSLATYFGERPLEIVLYDADEERLDLFDRFARLCFLATKAPHSLKATSDAQEALDGSDVVLLQVGENCANKYLKQQRRQGYAPLVGPAIISQAIDLMLGRLEGGVRVLSLLRDVVDLPVDAYIMEGWPYEPSFDERRGIPHQILRWIRGEEYLHEFMREHEKSPLKAWLDNPATISITEPRPLD